MPADPPRPARDDACDDFDALTWAGDYCRSRSLCGDGEVWAKRADTLAALHDVRTRLAQAEQIADSAKRRAEEAERLVSGTCGNCAFHGWLGASLDGYGAVRCKRHAPVAEGDKSAYPRGIWPIVQERDVCGDWRAAALTASAHQQQGVESA